MADCSPWIMLLMVTRLMESPLNKNTEGDYKV